MKYLIIIVLSMTVVMNNHAHDPHEAFFRINQTKDTVKIKAQFPWTLRNALIKFSPTLVDAKSSQDFERAFVEYVKKNIIMVDTLGAAMPFAYFEAFDNNGHSHESNYLLVFLGNGIGKITNSMMFDNSDKQTNYHYLRTENKDIEFQTSPKRPTFSPREVSNDSFPYWYLCLFIPFGLYYFIRLKNRR